MQGKARERRQDVLRAYRRVGRHAQLYDGMMQNASILGRLAIRYLWQMGEEQYGGFLAQAFRGIPDGFSGRLLEVPVGTGVLSMPVYRSLPKAEIHCLDYAEPMVSAAREHARELGVANAAFLQGDVGSLPFPDGHFDLLLSVNGFHAFPDKEAAYRETRRVLKDGGIFCGCMYVKGENRVTDLFVRGFCSPMGYFTPPYETMESLGRRLGSLYRSVELARVASFAGFVCRKGATGGSPCAAWESAPEGDVSP